MVEDFVILVGLIKYFIFESFVRYLISNSWSDKISHGVKFYEIFNLVGLIEYRLKVL